MPGFLVAALVVDSASGLCKAGNCWYFTSRCVPFCRFQARDARHHGLFGPEEQLCAWLVLPGVTIPLVLCSLFVFTPKMLGILVRMDQKDSLGGFFW